MHRVWLAQAALTAWLTLSLLLAPSRAVVRALLDGYSRSVDFTDLPALFGAPVPSRGMWGYLTEARPANACQPIEGPRSGDNSSLGAIALIRRYDCTFDLKVLHAQRAGFAAAVVHNVGSDELVRMAPVRAELRRQIAIPAVFVGEAAARDLRVLLRCAEAVPVLLLPAAPPRRAPSCRPALAADWTLGHGLASAAVALLVLPRLGLWARAWWSRAPSAKTQPRRKARVGVYTRGSDLCAICLDEYEEGDQLKILPCAHAFHRGCLDPWLAQAARRSCPLCTRPVASSGDGSDSAAESLDGEGPGAPAWAARAWLPARASLLQHRRPRVGRGHGPCRPPAREDPGYGRGQ